jgi:hypothetical protein
MKVHERFHNSAQRFSFLGQFDVLSGATPYFSKVDFNLSASLEPPACLVSGPVVLQV